MLDLQQQALEIIKDNHRLVEELDQARREFREFKQAQVLGLSLFTHADAYWKRLSNDTIDGPYCTGCWDSLKNLIRLHGEDMAVRRCPICKVETHNVGRPTLAGGIT